MTRRSIFLAALVAATLAPSAAQAQVSVVTTLPRPTEVRELDGVVVYSVWSPAIEAYRLTVRDAQGVRTLPVAPAPTPFEADIGTNSAGRPQVIFSLDVGTQEGGQAGGRDLFVIALNGGKARPVRNANTNLDERTPTIDAGRIAFSRVYEEGQGTADDKPVVYTKRLVAPRERPSTRLDGVPRRRDGETTTARTISELELGDGRLGEIVRYTHETAGGFRTNEVRQIDLDEKRSRLVANVITGLNGQFFVGLSFAEGYLAWYETSNFGNQAAGAYRYRPGRAYRYAEGPPYLCGFAWTGDGTWQVRVQAGVDCQPQTPAGSEDLEISNSPAPLVRTGDLDWGVVAADRVR